MFAFLLGKAGLQAMGKWKHAGAKTGEWELPLFFWMLVCSFGLHLAVGVGFLNRFDLVPYNIPWAVGVHEHWLSMYAAVENLDYPPLFPSLLGLVGGQVKAAQAAGDWQLTMFWIKLIPILADSALMCCVYGAARQAAPRQALLLSGAVGFCGAFFVNSAFWGQADSLMLCFLFLTVWKLEQDKPEQAAVWFALGCLTKLQTTYLAPLLLCTLLFRYGPARCFRALGLGLGVGIAGWLPFWISSGEPWLPFRIYLGGFGSYPYLNLNAYNAYGIFGGNWVDDGGKLLGLVPYSVLSGLVTLLFGAGVPLFGCLLERWKGIPFSPAACGFFAMNGIFLFACRMHERYQLPAVMLSLAAYLFTAKKEYLFFFFATSLLSFGNQGFLLFAMTYQGGFRAWFYETQPWFSAVNVGLFLVQAALLLRECGCLPSLAERRLRAGKAGGKG